MKRSVQIFNKVQEMQSADRDDDDYEHQYQTQPARPSRAAASPAHPGATHPFRASALNDPMLQKRGPSNRLSLPTHKGNHPSDSPRIASRHSKVSFIKTPSLKESQVIPKYVDANIIGNKDIYRQVALSPSRAPEIIFGNLRHNQMQFMQKRSALVAQARTMSQHANKPWAPGANVAAETRRISQ